MAALFALFAVLASTAVAPAFAQAEAGVANRHAAQCTVLMEPEIHALTSAERLKPWMVAAVSLVGDRYKHGLREAEALALRMQARLESDAWTPEQRSGMARKCLAEGQALYLGATVAEKFIVDTMADRRVTRFLESLSAQRAPSVP